MATAKKKTNRKVKKNVPEGIVYIQSTFNNTIITVTDKNGNVLAWSSSGHLKFKGLVNLHLMLLKLLQRTLSINVSHLVCNL